jgi:hypothetical protein
MKRSRKLKITTTHSRVLSTQSISIRAHCTACDREVETLTVAHSASILEVDPTTLTQLISDGLVHAIPTVTGSLLICRDSLFPSRRLLGE